jgi:hypothetical protein
LAPDWVLAYMADRDQVFREFHKQVGGKPFAPDFIDSLITVMRATEDACWTEQVWAWQRWRSWANSSKYAVSDWNPDKAWYLDQLDCCLDLWWLQQGRDVKWIDGLSRQAREDYRKDFRRKRDEREYPDLVALKYPINRAFSQLQSRGNLDFEGRKIYSLVSPTTKSTSPKVAGPRNFSFDDEDFMSWWKVAGPRNFSDFQEARERYNEAKKVARSAYRKYLDHKTFEDPILIEKITSNTSSSSISSVLEEETTTILPDIPPEEHIPPPPNSAGLDLGGGEDGGAPQEVVVDALEEELPDLLTTHGKGSPTKKQFSEVRNEISKLPEPKQEEAIFVRDYLPPRICKIQHAGALPTLAQEFVRIRLRQLEKQKSVAQAAASRAAPSSDQIDYARSVLEDPLSTDNERSAAKELVDQVE